MAPGRRSDRTGTDLGSGAPVVGAVVAAADVGTTVGVVLGDGDGAEIDGGPDVAADVAGGAEEGGGVGDPAWQATRTDASATVVAGAPNRRRPGLRGVCTS